MNDFFTYLTPAIFFAVLLIAGLICYFLSYRRTVLSWEQAHPLDWVSAPRFSFARKRHPMERKDRLPLLVITAVYAATAFFRLGSFSAPQAALDFGDRVRRHPGRGWRWQDGRHQAGQGDHRSGPEGG